MGTVAKDYESDTRQLSLSYASIYEKTRMLATATREVRENYDKLCAIGGLLPALLWPTMHSCDIALPSVA